MGMTKQRQLVLDIIRAADGHLTADEVYLRAKMEIDNIGLGTVYRNLATLCSDNLIRKVEVAGGPDRYDKNVSPHEHLRCVKCGRLLDIDVPLDGVYKRAEMADFQVLGCSLQILGLCSECRQKDITMAEGREEEKTNG